MKASRAEAFEFGGASVRPGTRRRVELKVARLVTQTWLSMPVIVFNGHRPGPTVWLSAAVHGDEFNGTESIRQVLQRINPRRLCGTVLAVPVVNVFAFTARSRYLPDRRDLNRCFPGSTRGSLGSRLAKLFMTEVVKRCDYGIDLHTGSHLRDNLPQLRCDLSDPETLRCAEAFAAPLMINASPVKGTLRAAARKAGVTNLLYEAGEAMRFDARAINMGVDGICRVLALLGMIETDDAVPVLVPASRRIESTKWVRARRSGLLRLDVELGDEVVAKQLLGAVFDPMGPRAFGIRSPIAGVVLGVSRAALVNKGDALVHVGV